MAVGAMRWLYRRLGGWYPVAFLAVELQSALFIVAGTLALLTVYWDGSTGEYLTVLAIALVLTEIAILVGTLRAIPRLRPIRRWIEGDRDPETSGRAWAAAVALPLDLIKKDLAVPVLLNVLPLCVLGVIILDLTWLTFFPLLAASAVAVGYSAMLHYLAVEGAMRPVLVDINATITPRTSANIHAVPLRLRLMVALPLINLITGLVVAALTSEGGGGSNLGVDVMVALLVATTISLELTVMLSKSLLRPIGDISRAVEAVNRGDFTASVPVTTGDELGDLAASFNEMVEGLRERERIREAFGTYLDQEVAEFILSEGFSDEGAEVEVSILFCDVRDFTQFSAGASPREVVASLNRLFEVVVPIVARHGGHVDKFEGDGLLAVFGAPQPFTDHAERAVRSACEISTAVNARNDVDGLRVGVGVNSGTVVAGAVGGGGRLNFSIIGNAVNVAARVEAATRVLDDSVLITGDTWKLLGPEFGAESRGKIEIRGITDPVSVYAPRIEDAEPPPPAPPTEEPAGVAAATASRLRRIVRPRIRR